jgi:hypothetical protein
MGCSAGRAGVSGSRAALEAEFLCIGVLSRQALLRYSPRSG